MYSHTKHEHEFVDSPLPSTCYIVFSTPRCGSSLICEALCNTGLAGAPTEYFDENTRLEFCRRWQADSWDDYLTALLKKKTGPNGVFGCKAHFHQFEIAFGTEQIPPVFPNLKFIWLTRQDKVRQAVSYARAIQTDQWSSQSASNNNSPVFDYQQIERLQKQTEREEMRLEDFLKKHSISPLKLVYEQITTDPFSAAVKCLEYLEVVIPESQSFSPITLTKQSDELSEDWIKRYLKMQANSDAN